MNTRTILVLAFLVPVAILKAQKITFSGRIFEKGTKESLIGANVYVPSLKAGTTTNTYGFYSITLPVGKYTVYYSFVGYTADSLVANGEISLVHDVYLEPSANLSVVEITGTKAEKQSQDVQMSRVSVPIQQIKSLPAFLGEKDVLKVLQLMPGVQKGHEGSTGIYVRGGGPDQNLIILDDAVVYNANHLFGFFSLFNGDALKSVELYKGGFPARYGGRLSSVIEINMKDGNREKITGEAGIGIISSRLTLEGPVVKNKSSFLVSARRTYIDALARPLMKVQYGVAGYYFYDLNAKLNYDFGRKDKLYLSGYFGRDKFFMRQEGFIDSTVKKMNAGLYWQNATATLRWNHLFTDKLFLNTSLITTHYNLKIFDNENYGDNESSYLNYISSIHDYSIKSDLNYYLSPSHTLRFGFQSTYHQFRPSAMVLKMQYFNTEKKSETTGALENGMYVEDLIRLEKFRFNPGLRFSHFLVEKRNYFSAEPRLSASYAISPVSSVKASFATMKQYIHLLSNTGVGLPTDLWVPATDKVKPQQSWQAAAGYARDFTKYNLGLSAELYYKEMKNIIGYREGASFIMIEELTSGEEVDWQKNVTSGKGKSYGMELLLQRKTGKLSGWIGYTLSWTRHQFDELNNGESFWAKYDRRHDLSLVAVYNLNERITLSCVWVFGTGEAITLPQAKYFDIPDSYVPGMSVYGGLTDYGKRNDFRMKNYHRLDLCVQFHKKVRLGERTWEFGVYNAYARKNPFFYTLDEEYEIGSGKSRTVLKQVSLFPLVPSISYTLKF